MDVVVLIGRLGAKRAAVMVDPENGWPIGPVWLGADAPDQIDAFVEWMRRLSFITDADEIGLEPHHLPDPMVDAADVRAWPADGLAKLVTYYWVTGARTRRRAER